MIVKIDNSEVTVEKLPLRRYAELLNSLEALPKHLKTLDKLDTETIIENLPKLVSSSLPDLIRIICVASDAKEDEVENWGLHEFTKVFVAILEVNKYQEVFETVKKAFNRQKQVGA